MKINISRDARPQVRLLLLATAVTFVLWFIPFASILTYPFRIFVTFIHEGGHALAALLTRNSVSALSVSMNGEGLTYTSQGNIISQVFVSSAGYLGAMTYGALLLFLIRRAVAARIVLLSTAGFILVLTLVYGLLFPTFSGNAGLMTGIPFTLVSGIAIAAGLVAITKYASARVAGFFLSFLAIQCVLNALSDLKSLFFLSSPFGPTVPTDAANMANAFTGWPLLNTSMFWTLAWAGIALVILSLALRAYAVSRERAAQQQDLPFEEQPLEV